MNAFKIQSSLGALALATVIAALASGAAAEEKKLDFRDNASQSGYRQVAFFAKPGRSDSAAFVACSKGSDAADAKIEAAHGQMAQGSDSSFGAIAPKTAAEQIAAARGDENAGLLFTVIVDSTQYKAAIEVLGKWKDREFAPADQNQENINFLQNVTKAIGLRKPYVSGLRRMPPAVYIQDLPIFNRKK